MAAFDISSLLASISSGASDEEVKALAEVGNTTIVANATLTGSQLAPPGSSPVVIALAELASAVTRRAPGLVDYMEKVLKHAHEDPAQVMALTDEQLAVLVSSAQALASSPKSVVRASVKEDARLMAEGFGDDADVSF
jgi:UDP-N-acetyl-D-mannosaminuronic acid transferase (WecB/TagA/CpsF family)